MLGRRENSGENMSTITAGGFFTVRKTRARIAGVNSVCGMSQSIQRENTTGFPSLDYSSGLGVLFTAADTSSVPKRSSDLSASINTTG